MDKIQQQLQVISSSYMTSAISGDREGSKQLLSSAVEALGSVLDAYEQVITPALNKIGQRWKAGKLSIAEEHLATQITLEQMTLLREKIEPRTALGKKVLATTLPRDLHILGARMVADFFYADGWDVSFLGAETPISEVISFVQKNSIEIVLVSISSTEAAMEFRQLASEMKSLDSPPMLIAGGRACDQESVKPLLVGANLVAANPKQAIEAARKFCKISGSKQSLDQTLNFLGSRIQEVRAERGLSQQNLSEVSGLDRAYISSIENGKKNLTISALLRIAESLDTDVKEFL